MKINLNNYDLDRYLKSLLGDQYSSFLSSPPEPVAIRTNTLKATTKQICRLLDRYQYNYKNLSFNPDGFTLATDPIPLSHSLAFFEGFLQYQGISSQLPVIILNTQPGERVLDMAAAPGSKSSQIAALMAEKGELVLNDSSYNRLQGLQANMQRCGATNHIVLKQRGENLSRIYPEYFDKILLDAPCTALGNHFPTSDVASWWSNEKLEKLSNLQYQLMVSALKCLRTGGEMVYSTCSVSPEENELMIEKIIRKYPVEIVKIDPAIQSKFDRGWTSYKERSISEELIKSLRTWPHQHGCEGFFVIKLRKREAIESENDGPSLKKTETLSADQSRVKKVLEELSESWGISEEFWQNFRYVQTKSRLWMIGAQIQYIPKDQFISGGLLLGEQRLNGWKLVNGSAQYLSNQIGKRRISLTDKELEKIFKEGKISFKNLPHDYYVLEYGERIIGSLYHERGTLRIRLPHLFRRFRN
jgi:16S rRNA (cytosine1407-C5)-methyltransferase